MTLAQNKRFRPKNPEIKKMSYNVVMTNPRLAKDSVEVIRKKFEKADKKGKQNIIDMLRMASVIAMNDAKDTRKFKRTQREKIFEIGIMYMSLRRDLENEFKKLKGG